MKHLLWKFTVVIAVVMLQVSTGYVKAQGFGEDEVVWNEPGNGAPSCEGLVEVYIQPIPCGEECGGSIIIAPGPAFTNPVTYTWSSPQLGGVYQGPSYSNTSSGLCDGQYDVTITDANGVTCTLWVKLRKATNDINITFDQVECFQDFKTGLWYVHIDAKPSGGNPARDAYGDPVYSYEWSNVGPSHNHHWINIRPGETVSVTVTDARGCTATANVTAQSCPIPPGGGDRDDFIEINPYPSLTTGLFNLEITTQSPTPIDITIRDYMGNSPVYHHTVSNHVGTQSYPVDISMAIPNPYVITVVPAVGNPATTIILKQ